VPHSEQLLGARNLAELSHSLERLIIVAVATPYGASTVVKPMELHRSSRFFFASPTHKASGMGE